MGDIGTERRYLEVLPEREPVTVEPAPAPDEPAPAAPVPAAPQR